MRLLWVTSCAADMYEASGKELVESFLATGTEGTLLACLEGLGPQLAELQAQVAPDRVLYQDLDQCGLLRHWLTANADLIPRHLGGTNEGKCRCPGGPLEPHSKKHKPGCIGQWFNRNASRWFRKVPSLARAQELAEPGGPKEPRAYDCLIWLDADCRFRTRVTEKVVKGWLKYTSGVFYLKNKRPVLEAGVVGYHLGNGGGRVLEALGRRYLEGTFRQDPRWDDSYQLQRAIGTLSNRVRCLDIAYGVGAHAAVVPYSPLGPYIEHAKGRHGRELRIMT